MALPLRNKMGSYSEEMYPDRPKHLNFLKYVQTSLLFYKRGSTKEKKR